MAALPASGPSCPAEWGNSPSKCRAEPPAFRAKHSHRTIRRNCTSSGGGTRSYLTVKEEGRLYPFRRRSGTILKTGGGHYLCFLAAELASLGPRRLGGRRNALQTAPGTTRGINTVPKPEPDVPPAMNRRALWSRSGLGWSQSVTEAEISPSFRPLAKQVSSCASQAQLFPFWGSLFCRVCIWFREYWRYERLKWCLRSDPVTMRPLSASAGFLQPRRGLSQSICLLTRTCIFAGWQSWLN